MQSRCEFLGASSGLSAAYLALNGSLKGADRPAARPNIILCMADDQAWREMGYYGHPVWKTPVFDEMAAGGFLSLSIKGLSCPVGQIPLLPKTILL